MQPCNIMDSQTNIKKAKVISAHKLKIILERPATLSNLRLGKESSVHAQGIPEEQT